MDQLIQLFLLPETYISLFTLTIMEIVLGIDNIIFISIVTSRLAVEEQGKARSLGLGLALGFRILLLMAITWIVGLTEPLFTVLAHGVSGRDLVLICGGLFLIIKSTSEIHEKFEDAHAGEGSKKALAKFWPIVAQIIILDLVFSFDSVITAVGLVKEVSIMIIAVILSLIVMFIFAKSVSDFVNHNPTIKMLALSFLLMIGSLLVAEGFHQEIPKGYIYFAMAFSVFVEFLNIKLRKIQPK